MPRRIVTGPAIGAHFSQGADEIARRASNVFDPLAQHRDVALLQRKAVRDGVEALKPKAQRIEVEREIFEVVCAIVHPLEEQIRFRD